MEFQQAKLKSLSQVDRSKKGSIDAPIANLVDTINSLPVYFTTSSCSGRTAVFWQDCQDGAVGQKKEGIWLYSTHELVIAGELVDALSHAPQSGEAALKFEPVVLHVQCLSLQDAQNLLVVALQSGLRNSGIVLGRKHRIMLAIRSTHGLEVPLIANGELLVSVEYVQHLATVANGKMVENGKRIARLAAGVDSLCRQYSAQSEQDQETSRCVSGRRPHKKDKPVKSKDWRGKQVHDRSAANGIGTACEGHAGRSESATDRDDISDEPTAVFDKDLMAQSNDRDSDDDIIGLAHITHD